MLGIFYRMVIRHAQVGGSVRLNRLVVLALLLACSSIVGVAQEQAPAQNANVSAPRTKTSDPSDAKIMTGTPEAEMLARREIKAAEKDYKENLERAREAAQLGAEMRDAFMNTKDFSRTEQKKLERLEKITRKLRNEAGGSDAELTVEDPPSLLEAALARLAELTDTLRKGVEKTPRQVISAAVIERANEVLEIIRVVRTITH
ncbi:MAG: hypothetical protein QOJ64_2413 [Acidobacteriota bacterium]|jgi:hypothetical protein|nr:hypothetical protein [Acidobacteriota bacterium]